MSVVRESNAEVGRFRLERKLGEGGMGEVWSAAHLQTRKSVALKFLKADGASDPQHAKRFLREARAASAVRHPNVVQIHDVLELPTGEFVIVMDLLRGEDLGQLLLRRGALSLGEVASLMLPVVEALGVAHAAGIVHRDLKPENIFLDQPVPGRVQPKVLDFGIAKLTAQAGPAEQSMQLTRTGTVMGSPYYMSPEQIYGEADLDVRSDVWSVGVILYELLCGGKPFGGDNIGQLFKAITHGTYTTLAVRLPHLPRDVTDLVAQMLQPDRAHRAQDLAPALERLSAYRDSTPLASFGTWDVAATATKDHSDVATGPTEVLPAAPPSVATRSAPIARPFEPARTAGTSLTRNWLGVLALLTAAALAWFGLRPEDSTTDTASATSDVAGVVAPGESTLPAVDEASNSLSGAASSAAALQPAAANASATATATIAATAASPTPESATRGSSAAGSRQSRPASPQPPVNRIGERPAAASTAGGSATEPASSTGVSSPSGEAKLPGSIVSEAPF